jgi:hypothetical protein
VRLFMLAMAAAGVFLAAVLAVFLSSGAMVR